MNYYLGYERRRNGVFRRFDFGRFVPSPGDLSVHGIRVYPTADAPTLEQSHALQGADATLPYIRCDEPFFQEVATNNSLTISGVVTADTTADLTVGSIGVASGTIYMVIVPASDSAPSASQVASGLNAANADAVWAEARSVLNNDDMLVESYGLTDGVAYKAYAVHVAIDDTLGSVAGSGSFSAADVTAPELTSVEGTPGNDYTDYDEASLVVNTDTAEGTVYAVLTTSATAPSAAQVMAGNDHTGSAAIWSGSQVVTNHGPQTFDIVGLPSAVTLYPYVTQTDSAGNTSSVAEAEAPFTTPSATIVLQMFDDGDSSVANAVNVTFTDSYADPDAGTNAVLVANDGTASTAWFSATMTFADGVNEISFSVKGIAKSTAKRWVEVRPRNTSTQAAVNVNVTDGAFGASLDERIFDESVTDLGGGWYRFQYRVDMSGDLDLTGSLAFYLADVDNDDTVPITSAGTESAAFHDITVELVTSVFAVGDPTLSGISADAPTLDFSGLTFTDELTDGAGTPVDVTTALKTRQGWQRGTATVVLEGTYSVVGGDPSAMAWRVGSGDWVQFASATIGSGSWQGTLSIPSDYLAQGTLQIKPINGENVTPYELPNVTVSDVFAICGDSMAAGIADTDDTYTSTNYDWVFFRNGSFDSVTADNTAWPQLAERLDQAGIPPLFVQGEAAPGSAFHPGSGGSWDPTPSGSETSFYYDNAVADLNDCGAGGFKLLIWEHGPNDVVDGSTTYGQDLKDLIDAFQTDVNNFASVKMLISIVGQVNNETTNLDAVRSDQVSAIETDADILRGPSWIDLEYGDDVHVGVAPYGTEQQQLVGNRWWRAIQYHCYTGSALPTGPTISSASVTDTNRLTVTFDRAVVNHTDTTGWKVEDNAGVVTIASAVQGAAATQVVLTFARNLTTNSGEVESVSVSFGEGQDSVGATLADTQAIPYPPEYEVDYDAGEAYPFNTAQPALSQPPAVGVEVTCDGGSWESTSALSLAYQWLEEVDGAEISGATSASYTPVSGDSAYISTMVCRVTATNSAGSVSVNSDTGVFDPSGVFVGGKQGGWWRIDQIGSLYQDSARSTAVAANNDPVGGITDSSGNGNHMIQATADARPSYDTDDAYANIQGDGSNDALQTAATAMDGDILMIVAADFSAVNGTVLSIGNVNDVAEVIELEHNRVRAPTNDFSFIGTVSIAPSGDAVVCVVATESDRTTRVYVNGTLIGSIVWSGSLWFDTTNTNKVISLMRRIQVSFPDFSSGAIFGALVVVGSGVADDRAELETYFGNLVGLSL